MFLSKTKKNRYTPVLLYKKCGSRGYTLHVHVFVIFAKLEVATLEHWTRHVHPGTKIKRCFVIFYSFHWKGTSTVKTQTTRFRSRSETRDQRESCATSVENQLIIGTRRNSSSFVKTVTPKVRFSKVHSWLLIVCNVCFIFIAHLSCEPLLEITNNL